MVDCFHKNSTKCKDCRLSVFSTIKNNTVKADVKKRIKPVLTETGKICIACNLDLELNCFEKNRNQCKDCRKKAQIDRLNNTAIAFEPDTLITEKTCKNCRETKSINNFQKSSLNAYRNECKSCRYNSRYIKDKKDVVKENACKSKKCIECCEIKTVVENFSINTNTYRNVCKACINKKKYYENYRNRKRLEDNASFVANNTLVHRKWVENNKEHFLIYMKKYGTSISGIVSRYNSRKRSENSDDFKNLIAELIILPCFYCGHKDDEYYNGVDRINSSVGYTKENSVPCCFVCNNIKNTLDVASFLRKVREIAIYNKNELGIDFNLEPLPYHSGLSLVGGSTNFRDYKMRAKKRNLDFTLSTEMFKDLTKQSCYLCGENNLKGIGIDRLDNNIGYIIENCKPCCSYCNYMKKVFSYEDFMTSIKNITTFSTTEDHQKICENCIPCRALNKVINWV